MIEDSSSHPADLPENHQEAVEDGLAAKSPKPGRQWAEIWENLLRLGLGETALRIGTGVVSLALILLVVWVMPRGHSRSARS